MEKGLTQNELALKSLVSRPNLSAIEHGGRDVTVQTLRRLSNALGVRPGILIDGIAPSSSTQSSLSRESLDRIARAILGQPVHLSPDESGISADMCHLLKNKLRLVKQGKRDPRRTVRLEEKALLEVRGRLGHQQFKNILSRIEKMMGTQL